MRGKAIAAVALLALVASGCTSGLGLAGGSPPTSPPETPASSTLGTDTPTTAQPQPPVSVLGGGTACSYRQTDGYVLPDPGCTPGVTNSSVSQAHIDQTICVRGWTSTVRPPESYTETLKREQMDRYGDAGSMSGYEEDHLIPLELGGSPADPRNLWPQPGASPNPKDDVEYAANRAVCSGRMSLAEAQREIAGNWVTLGRALGVLEGAN